MQTPILGSAYTARSVNAADSRMVNLFPEVVPEGGKQPAFLQRAPGLLLRTTVGTGPIRGMWPLGAYFYVASGNTFYRISGAGDVVALGNIAGSGPVVMADNGTQIMIAADPAGYIYSVSTGIFSQITDASFPGASMVGYLDGYFVFIQPNSQKVWVTSLLDGTSIDPLDFASAEGNPDNIVSMIVDHREVWLFGDNSTEVWYNAGLSDFPLVRIQGAYNELGCAARYSVAKMNNQVYWLGKDARGQGIVYVANGYQGQRVSTHSVEWQIQQYGDLSDAIGFTYQQDGHMFYVLNFPSSNKTWAYDAATGAWHERAGWDDQWVRYRAHCQVFFQSKNFVGDYENGNIYELDLDTYDYNNTPQRWLRSWRALPTGQNNLNRTAQHALQLDCETGVGLEQYPGYDAEDLTAENGDILLAEYVQNEIATESGDVLTTELSLGVADALVDAPNYPFPFVPPVFLSTTSYLAKPGYDPQVMLRWSDDGGHTWSNEHWRSMGKIGAYGYRTYWRRLGMTLKIRDRVYEVSGTDPVKLAIMGAELQISGTNG